MSLNISGFSSPVIWPQSQGTPNIGQLDSFNLNRFNQVNLQKQAQAAQDQRGLPLQLHHVPEALQFIAKKIQDRFHLEIMNSDSSFTETELKIMYYTLSTLPPEDLLGVKMIVKNKGLALNLQQTPADVFMKHHRNKVYGAYDKQNQRILIFDLEKPEQLHQVIKHEVGHAVHSNNLSFDEFFMFTLKSGWTVAQHEQKYIPGNELYTMGMSTVKLDPQEAWEARAHFDWDSLKERKDHYNKYTLLPPENRRHLYAYRNPFETFAVLYEKTH
jgi:hypothetical protein